jgi:hypothetical protein
MGKITPEQIISIVNLLLQAITALQQSGVLKHSSTLNPGLHDARALLKDHFAEVAATPEKE